MTAQLPITPAVLRWARIRSGYSIEELESKKQFARIRQWECEDSNVYPTYNQLESLADKFKVPVAVFFFPEPPDVPTINKTFRTVETRFIDSLPPRITHLLRKAKAFQLSLSELHTRPLLTESLITRQFANHSTKNFTELAMQVRNYLGITVQQQTKWRDENEALAAWRQALTGAGIYVFKDQFRVEGYSGFCLFDEHFPIIYVNNTNTKTRQIFTLFHELAHLLFQTSGIDFNEYNRDQIEYLESSKIEIDCNKFAANFLVPDYEFEQIYQPTDKSEHSVEQIAKYFHVSRELIYRKILDRNDITQSQYKTAVSQWTAQIKPKTSGGDFYRTIIAYLGSDYIKLAFSNYYQNKIDEYQLADYLNIKHKQLEKFEKYYIKE